jgi:hypothetical protein
MEASKRNAPCSLRSWPGLTWGERGQVVVHLSFERVAFKPEPSCRWQQSHVRGSMVLVTILTLRQLDDLVTTGHRSMYLITPGGCAIIGTQRKGSSAGQLILEAHVQLRQATPIGNGPRYLIRHNDSTGRLEKLLSCAIILEIWIIHAEIVNETRSDPYLTGRIAYGCSARHGPALTGKTSCEVRGLIGRRLGNTNYDDSDSRRYRAFPYRPVGRVCWPRMSMRSKTSGGSSRATRRLT